MGAVNFYRHVVEHTGMSLEAAKRATPAVLQALRDRLTPQEARQRPHSCVERRPAYLRRPAAGLGSTREARALTLAVFAALKVQVSPGEAEDVHAQLPKDLKALWEEA